MRPIHCVHPPATGIMCITNTVRIELRCFFVDAVDCPQYCRFRVHSRPYQEERLVVRCYSSEGYE